MGRQGYLRTMGFTLGAVALEPVILFLWMGLKGAGEWGGFGVLAALALGATIDFYRLKHRINNSMRQLRDADPARRVTVPPGDDWI